MSYGQIAIIKRTGEDSGITCPLTAKGVTIGRDLNCDIRVQMAKVSRLHCKLSIDSNQVVLQNLSKNSIMIKRREADIKLGRNNQQELKDGDIFRIVDRNFRYDSFEDKENINEGNISIKDASSVLTVAKDSHNRRKISIEPNESSRLGKRKRSSSFIFQAGESQTEKIPRINELEASAQVKPKKNSLPTFQHNFSNTEEKSKPEEPKPVAPIENSPIASLDCIPDIQFSEFNDRPLSGRVSQISFIDPDSSMETSFLPVSDIELEEESPMKPEIKDPSIAISDSDRVFHCGQVLKKQVGQPSKFQARTPKPTKAAARPSSILKKPQTERKKKAIRVSFATQDKVLLTPMNPQTSKPALLYKTPAKTRSPTFKSVELPVLPRMPDEFKDNEYDESTAFNAYDSDESDESDQSDDESLFVIRTNGVSPSMFNDILSEKGFAEEEIPLDDEQKAGEAEAIAELTSNRESFGERNHTAMKLTTRTKNRSLAFLSTSPPKRVENSKRNYSTGQITNDFEDAAPLFPSQAQTPEPSSMPDSVPSSVQVTPIAGKTNNLSSNCKSTGRFGITKNNPSTTNRQSISEGMKAFPRTSEIQFTPPREPFTIMETTSTPLAAPQNPTAPAGTYVDMKLFSCSPVRAGKRKHRSQFHTPQPNQKPTASPISPLPKKPRFEETAVLPVPLPQEDDEEETNVNLCSPAASDNEAESSPSPMKSLSPLNTPPLRIERPSISSTPLRFTRNVASILTTPVRAISRFFSAEAEVDDRDSLISIWKTIRDFLREETETPKDQQFIAFLYEGNNALFDDSFVTKKQMFDKIRNNTYRTMEEFSNDFFDSLDHILERAPELSKQVKLVHKFSFDIFNDKSDASSESEELSDESILELPGTGEFVFEIQNDLNTSYPLLDSTDEPQADEEMEISEDAPAESASPAQPEDRLSADESVMQSLVEDSRRVSIPFGESDLFSEEENEQAVEKERKASSVVVVDHVESSGRCKGRSKSLAVRKSGSLFMNRRFSELNKDTQVSLFTSPTLSPGLVVEAKNETSEEEEEMGNDSFYDSVTIDDMQVDAIQNQIRQEKAQEHAAAEERARLEAEENARAEAEMRAQLEAEEQARKQARKEAEEKARAEELARKQAEENARKEAEMRARLEAEEQARKEAEEQARKEAEENARKEAEEKARNEAEEQARLKAAAAEKARKEAEEIARKEAEEKVRKEAEIRAQLEAEEQARKQAEAEEKARKEAEEKARKEAEEQARLEAEEKARKEAEEKARAAAEKKARKEAEEKARKEAEEKARAEAEEQARVEAEEKARKEAEEQARLEAEEKARAEAEEQARLEAEEKARKEAEEKAQLEAEEKAREEAEEKAPLEAEEKLKKQKDNESAVASPSEARERKKRRVSRKSSVQSIQDNQSSIDDSLGSEDILLELSDEILIDISDSSSSEEEDKSNDPMDDSNSQSSKEEEETKNQNETSMDESDESDIEIIVELSSEDESEEEEPQPKEKKTTQKIPKVKEVEQQTAKVNYNKWTCVQLRKELKDRKLETKGLKAELIRRLEENDNSASVSAVENSSSEAESQSESEIQMDVDVSKEEEIQIETEEKEEVDYNKMTCVVLRKELKSRGLDTKGLKKQLVERLKESDNNNNAPKKTKSSQTAKPSRGRRTRR